MRTRVGRFNHLVTVAFHAILHARYDLRRLLASLPAIVLAGALAEPAIAQNYLTSTGMPSFNAPEPVELGFVDTSNGELHLSIPLGTYPQRGTGQPQAITFNYDSNIWTVELVDGLPTWVPLNGPTPANDGGWYLSLMLKAGLPGFPGSYPQQGCMEDMPWADQNGTIHTFHIGTAASGCPSQSSAYATDSSGYEAFIAAGGDLTVYAPDGTAYPYAPFVQDSKGNYILSEDSNGNYLSQPTTPAVPYSLPATLIDTLGRQLVEYNGDGADSYYPTTLSTSEGTASYYFTFKEIDVKTNFQQANITEGSAGLIVARSLTLPDAAQSTFYFTYDCDESTGNPACGSPAGQSAYYGELISVTLPTGGIVRYSYTTFKDAYGNMGQWVSTRSSAGGSWTYQPEVLSTCGANQVNCQQQTTVHSPTGQTVYTFQLNNGAWPISVARKDPSGNVLSTVTNTWDFSQPCVTINCNGASYVRLLTQQTAVSTQGGNLTKQTQYTYDSPQYGNKTAIKEWEYIPSGSSFSSVPNRATYISYLYYTGTNNINRPLSVAVCNNSGSDSACPGGGSRVSQTLYGYDCYSGTGCTALTGVNGAANHNDTNFGVSYTARGNLTSVARWVSGSSYLTTSYRYDTTGQILAESDPAGNSTTFGYADKFYTDHGNGTTPSSYAPSQPTNAYVTSVTDAIGTQTRGYYWGSGNVAVATDYNNQSSYSHYQDSLDRQTEEIDPIGWSLATYSSATQSDAYMAVADTSPSITCVSCQHKQTILDSWGRTNSQILVNNPIGPVETDGSYDADGRLYTQSHPYSGSGDPNHVSEIFSYDALDRQITTTHPDGQVEQVAYGPNIGNLSGASSQQGSTTTYGYGYPQVSQDESGNRRQQWSDGFGRIIEVDEPGTSGSLTASPFATNYIYDAGDRLIQVIQGAQSRIFAYDGIGRKTYESTPEGGTVTYSYLASGGGLCSGASSNVCQRTDARGVVSTYTYDHSNRLTGVAYTVPSGKNIAAMPNVCTTVPNGTSANVCNYYDQGGSAAYATGRLTEMVDATGSESYSHDANGRVTQLSKIINSQTYKIGYKYDAGGDVTQITYPSGRVVQQAFNQVGQLCQIASSAANCTAASSYYAANFSYNAPGKLLGFNYGNGLTATFYYSPNRTQLTYLAYTKGTSTYFNLQYSYQQNSLYSPPCPLGTTGNNGTVQCITDNVDSGRSVGYGYDPLQRMTSAMSCGSSAFPKWGLTESYDRFGNRWSQTMTAGSGPQGNMSFGSSGMNSSTTNQPNGYTYDASGNMTVEPLSPSNSMTYDGENQMTAFQGSGGAAGYSYDGNGLRVVKSVSGGTTTVSIYSGSSVIAEYDNGVAPSLPSREYVYNGAGDTTGLLAMFSGGATTYYHQDHLSVRLTTDGTSGSPTYGEVLSQQGSFPFGEQWYQSGSGNKWFFTSYDRDSESGLDYALARYYNSRTGTFCSADPLAGSPGDPQSWNRYPYGRNDPIGNTDPSGKGVLSMFLSFGIDMAIGIFAPELVSFIGDELGALGGGGSLGYSAGDLPDTFTNTPTLLTRATAQATTNVAEGAGGAAGGAGPPIAAGMAAAAEALQNAQKNAKLAKKDCPKDLSALGTTAAAVQQGLQHAQLNNGATSNDVKAGSLGAGTPFAAGVSATYGKQTVSQVMDAQPGTKAMAQLAGNSIYINPAKWMMSDYFKNEFDMFHEVVAHNVAGLSDQAAAKALGVKISKDNTTAISDKLGKDCF